MFASLGRHRTDDAVVLDLYAGSGALAIEALSRGAARAVLVDHDRAAEAAILANLHTVGFDDVARLPAVVGGDRSSQAPVPEAPFGVVFLDPPYDTTSGEVAATLSGLADAGMVVPGGTVVVERPKSGEPVALPEGWRIEKERAYGDTLLVVAIA